MKSEECKYYKDGICNAPRDIYTVAFNLMEFYCTMSNELISRPEGFICNDFIPKHNTNGKRE